MRLDLLRTGRWLAIHHPEVTTPADFARELTAELVAAVNQMCIGDFSCEHLNVPLKEPGKHLVFLRWSELTNEKQKSLQIFQHHNMPRMWLYRHTRCPLENPLRHVPSVSRTLTS